MSSNRSIGKEVSVDAQALEQADNEAVDEQPLRPTVAQQTQAKVDTNHPDARPAGMTLEAEERMRAREREIARTRERAMADPDTTRERGSRQCADERRRQARERFAERRAAVAKWADPERTDPREELSQDELAAVNEQAARIADEVERGASRAAIARQLAERVADGADVVDASLAVLEREYERPGAVVPIGQVGEVDARTVTVAGRVETLWDPAHPSMRQVGLLADDTGRVKLTVWNRSGTSAVLREGDHVRVTAAQVHYHEGRPSIAADGWTRIAVQERGDGPATRFRTTDYET